MEEEVTRLIVGTSCPFCSGDRLYRLRVNRFPCNGCSCKESQKLFCDANCFGGKRTGTKGFRHGGTSREVIYYDVTAA